ncbi:Transmembrane channel-like protein 5 [Desmophyllum pertusum]|uniref:Transmembrane channel-like protein 5 n=1 Tax=Desmophyllum pertusum TaxID=174260 RepID=A0A9W9YGT2_9CNID|nr:Transmembrane channel-like protein 5 [Desmophyllum pertusum]
MAGAAYLIQFSASLSLASDTDAVLAKLLLPLVVSVINLVMPMAFRIIASLERYRSPRTTINVNLARTTIMMLTSVTMVIVLLFVDIQRCRRGQDLIGSESTCEPAIESVGKIMLDLHSIDLSLWTSLSCCCQRSLVNLSEGLVHSTVPCLPLIQVIKLLILFYVKRTSVVMNCRPSMRPFRAARMNLLFLFLLAVSFALSLVVIGYTIMSADVTYPSALCGPFKGQAFMYQVVTDTVSRFPKWLRLTISYMSSASFIAMLFCILGIIVYYHKMLKDSNEKKIKLLKETNYPCWP